MNDFNPQGLPNKIKKSEYKWREIVFRIEEIEGKVIRDSIIQRDCSIHRKLLRSPNSWIDTIMYKGKPILVIMEQDGEIKSIQQL